MERMSEQGEEEDIQTLNIEVRQRRRKLNNEELHKKYSAITTIKVIKSRRTRKA
jgi:uncharacterized protein YggE